MISNPDRISFYLILIYTILLFYYSIQLLVYTDEFALNVLGSFNHSIAGLCEIIGIIFLSLTVGLLFTVFKGTQNQNILYLTILIMQILITINFWRYIITDSPGETDINTILYNAIIFSLMSILLIIVIYRLRKSLFNSS